MSEILTKRLVGQSERSGFTFVERPAIARLSPRSQGRTQPHAKRPPQRARRSLVSIDGRPPSNGAALPVALLRHLVFKHELPRPGVLSCGGE
jgi:hypothetical protein